MQWSTASAFIGAGAGILAWAFIKLIIRQVVLSTIKSVAPQLPPEELLNLIKGAKKSGGRDRDIPGVAPGPEAPEGR